MRKLPYKLSYKWGSEEQKGPSEPVTEQWILFHVQPRGSGSPGCQLFSWYLFCLHNPQILRSWTLSSQVGFSLAMSPALRISVGHNSLYAKTVANSVHVQSKCHQLGNTNCVGTSLHLLGWQHLPPQGLGDFWDCQGSARVLPQPVCQLQCLHGLLPPLFCSHLIEFTAWKPTCWSFLSVHHEDIVGFPCQRRGFLDALKTCNFSWAEHCWAR